ALSRNHPDDVLLADVPAYPALQFAIMPFGWRFAKIYGVERHAIQELAPPRSGRDFARCDHIGDAQCARDRVWVLRTRNRRLSWRLPPLLRRIRWRLPRICHVADANMRATSLAYTTFR